MPEQLRLGDDPENGWVAVTLRFPGPMPTEVVADMLLALEEVDARYAAATDDRRPVCIEARQGSIELVHLLPGLVLLLTHTKMGRAFDELVEGHLRAFIDHSRRHLRWRSRPEPHKEPLRVRVDTTSTDERTVTVDGKNFRIVGDMIVKVSEARHDDHDDEPKKKGRRR